VLISSAFDRPQLAFGRPVEYRNALVSTIQSSGDVPTKREMDINSQFDPAPIDRLQACGSVQKFGPGIITSIAFSV
jgi:hypothetical protein